MREVLFRGKALCGKWVEGLPYEVDGVIGCIRVKEQIQDIIFYTTYKVIPETVGQYTGLTDKNGKKIFEGDIVLYARDEELGQISYHEGEAMFVVEFDTWVTDFDHMYGKDLEIIGNIHDNPELMKGGAE